LPRSALQTDTQNIKTRLWRHCKNARIAVNRGPYSQVDPSIPWSASSSKRSRKLEASVGEWRKTLKEQGKGGFSLSLELSESAAIKLERKGE